MAIVIPAATIAAIGVGTGLFFAWPRDPAFEVVSLNIAGFKLRFVTESPLVVAVIDAEMTLYIKVTNTNYVGIQYTDTIMDIFYKDTLLGQATVESGKQAARCEKVIEVPARMDGLEVSGHVLDLMNDVRKREMCLKSHVTISGAARMFVIRHPFKCYVDSDIKIDPIFLNIIDQENRVKMELGLSPSVDLKHLEGGKDPQVEEAAEKEEPLPEVIKAT